MTEKAARGSEEEIMIRANLGRSKKQALGTVPAPSEPGGYLVGDAKHQARKPVPFLRVLGNLLILSGVLLLLGIGGWWGYQTWSVQTEVGVFRDKGVLVDPTVDAQLMAALPGGSVTPAPSATSIPVIAFQNLIQNLNGTTVPIIPAGGIIPTVTPIRDDSPPVHISIPSVKIDSKVEPVNWKMISKPGGGASTEWNVAAFAVGHHAGSSNPGQPGNVVMSGHVDYKGEVFKNLHSVNKGDEVILQTEKGQYMYVITDLVLVKEDGVDAAHKRANAHYMDQTAEPTLTLITCYPYGIDDHRFIAIGHPYQSETNTQLGFSLR